MSDDKSHRVVAARMKLKARFEAAMAASPSVADDTPQGTGPNNRHGMPRLPVGQVLTHKWPVLDLGIKPSVDTTSWRLRVDGAVERPIELSYTELLALPQTELDADFHCVTTWSRMDLQWIGVRLSDLIAAASPTDAAQFVLCHAYDDYTTNLPLHEALKDDVLIAHTVQGEPLQHDHGGPVRMITPQLYAWKGAKWISRIELLAADKLGFWERNGYSNTALPWRNDRYS
ncbi:MAG: sulfite oxidase-like oxidoreductase [Nannocystaceae bacterium]|nr:sulfite oxidase-like oxidoreductase [Nannocystaceae bacterium]